MKNRTALNFAILAPESNVTMEEFVRKSKIVKDMFVFASLVSVDINVKKKDLLVLQELVEILGNVWIQLMALNVCVRWDFLGNFVKKRLSLINLILMKNLT